MAITLRLTKGSELTFQELDNNFTDLNGRVGALETSDANDISLTSLSVTTASAGTAGLSYNNTTGVFTHTPPDLSSYLTSVPAQSFASLTGKPTTLAGYGITDAMVSGAAYDGDITGSVFGDDSTLLVDAVNNKIVGPVDTASVDAVSLRTSATSIALGYEAGNTGQGANAIAIGEKAGYANQAANSIVINATGTEVYNFGSGLVITPIANASGTHALQYDPSTGAVTYDTLASGGLPSRSPPIGATISLADGAEADLDITGFKSYTLMTITTDKAARVRLYVNAATRTADAAGAEGIDPTSDAGVIAEVITTGAETVIISPGAIGFNLESSPTTNIPCRVTNKSGSTGTVQVDLNILQLEA